MIEKIRAWGILPVVAIHSVEDAEPLAAVLTQGGLPVAEITLRTEAGLQSIGKPAKRDDYLKLSSVVACGGSWMVAADLIQEGRFDQVQRLTTEAVALKDSLNATGDST